MAFCSSLRPLFLFDGAEMKRQRTGGRQRDIAQSAVRHAHNESERPARLEETRPKMLPGHRTTWPSILTIFPCVLTELCGYFWSEQSILHTCKSRDRFGCYQMRSSRVEKTPVTHGVAVVIRHGHILNEVLSSYSNRRRLNLDSEV